MSSDANRIDKRKRRDHRVDALRGLALLMMLTDHVYSDWLNRLTMRNFGFAMRRIFLSCWQVTPPTLLTGG